MARLVVPILFALLIGGIYIAAVYAFFAYLWPMLPVWANVLLVIALALAFILSPLFLLLRLGRMERRPQSSPPKDQAKRDAAWH